MRGPPRTSFVPDTPRRLARLTRQRDVGLAVAATLAGAFWIATGFKERRLADLVADGERARAEVVEIHAGTRRRGGSRTIFTRYAYEIDGVAHETSVGRDRLALDVGARFALTYLPRRPSFNLPTDSRVDLEAALERHRAVQRPMRLAVLLLPLAIALAVEQERHAVAGRLGARATARGRRLRSAATWAASVGLIAALGLFFHLRGGG